MVHQHFMLIPVMTVAENIVLAEEPTYAGVMLDVGEARKRVRELSDRYGLAVDPDALIQDITVAQQQRVEILKALYRGAEILVLDEPTAVLTPQEARELFAIIAELKAQGTSIIFISHKLHEVLEVADRITVLRRGKTIDTVPAKGATEESLARMMVGREVLLRVDKAAAAPGDALLEVDDLQVFDDRGLEKVRGVSFHVRAREILAHRRGGRERPDRADRRAHRPAAALPGRIVGRREGRAAQRDRAGDARRRRGAHPGGPAAPRPRARVLDRGEHRAARLLLPAGLEGAAGSIRSGCSSAPHS